MKRIFAFAASFLLICQGAASALDWKPISHQESKLTIVSEDFSPSNMSWAKDKNSRIERAYLELRGTPAGLMVVDRLVTGNYCGDTDESIKRTLNSGSWLERYLISKGAPEFDFDKTRSQRTKFGFGKYLDLDGDTNRCIAFAQFTRAGTGTNCMFGGMEILILGVCSPKDKPEAADLDKRVFTMVDKMFTDGSGKDKIQ